MNRFFCILLLHCLLTQCTSQVAERSNDLKVGGPCEGCEAIYEYGSLKLWSVDTLPKFEEEQDKLKIEGTVFQLDGTTPAENVIIYIYQTNSSGVYETFGHETGWAMRHGYIRGWTKTGIDGRYTFYTFRPASYPNTEEPEHIHMTIKQPGLSEYYIDEIVFNNDPLLTESKRALLHNRGGSGISFLKEKNGLSVITRDIILGLNIPDYPAN